MSGGGGGSGNDGSNDMQVSGMEAAISKEKGISTHADSRTGSTSGYEGSDAGWAANDTSYAGVTPSNVGINPNTGKLEQESNFYSSLDNEQQATYDQGKSISQGTLEIDPKTGETRSGRYTTNPNTGQLERTDLSFSEHWNRAPDSIKFSPTLRFLYASGKNVGEWASKKGWNINRSNTNTTDPTTFTGGNGNNERSMMNALAPEAPYIVSGITKPTNSPASNWYANLGTTNTNQHSTDIATQYAAAKTAVSTTLKNKGAIGMLAVNQSPFYDWLKTNKIDKGIL